MSRHLRPIRRKDLEPVKRPDGQALYDPVTSALHSLDATSMAIWEACDGDTTVDELASAIADLGAIDREVSSRILDVALAELYAAGLLVDEQREEPLSRPK